MSTICFTIPNLLSTSECNEFIEWGEKGLYQAMGRDYPPSYRDNDRLVAHRPELAESLLKRLKPKLPQTLVRNGQTWDLVGLNPRFRGCRYRNGQQFTRHRDGAYSPHKGVQSFLTVMLYLNDESEFEGGATRFYQDRFTAEPDFQVGPRTGTGILFSHDYWHDGQEVLRGTKYVLRTDVLYRCRSAVPVGHRGYVWCVNTLDCGRLITGSRDKTIGLWSPEARLLSLFEQAHKSSVSCLEPLDGGFWSGSRDRHIASWRTSKGNLRKVNSWLAHDGAVLCLKALTGNRMLSSGADGFIRLWHGPRNLRGTLNLKSWVWCLCELDQGRWLAGTENGRLFLFNSSLRECEEVLTLSSSILSLHRLSHGPILMGSGNGMLTELNQELQILGSRPAHRGPVTTITSLSDGTAVSGGEDDGVRLWRDKGGLELVRHADFVRAVCVDNRDRIISASYDGSLQLSNPSAIFRTDEAANPGGAISGTAAAS